MRVRVTQAHIDAGAHGSQTSCAVAAAVGLAIGGGVLAAGIAGATKERGLPAGIFINEARVYADGHDLGELPPEASDWVDRFDSGGKVEPFEFELR